MKKYQLVDIGANLTDKMFSGIYNHKKCHENDLEEVLSRAKQSNIQNIIITGTGLKDCVNALELSKPHDNLFVTVGCHPTNCLEFEKTEICEGPKQYLEKLKQLIINNQSKVKAIGEFGLDYDRLHFCPRDIQLKYFEFQFELLEVVKLPLFLHCRNSFDDFYKIITRNRHKFNDGVVHSFTGSIEEANEFIKLGLKIGINGCSLKAIENLETVKSIELENIMIETDSPWCGIRPTHASYALIDYKTSVPYELKKENKYESGKMTKSRNEPCTLTAIVDVLAKLHQKDPVDVADIIYNTTIKFFDL